MVAHVTRCHSPNGISRRSVPIVALLIAAAGVQAAEHEYPEHRFLTAEAGVVDYWPSFSPDGTSIVFSRSLDGRETWAFFLVSSSAGNASSFSSSAAYGSGTRANWSWSDNQIAFTAIAEDRARLWVLDGDGASSRAIDSRGLSDYLFYPSWYPDGRSLAVLDVGDSPGQVLKKVDTESLEAVVLTDFREILPGMARVSPDGRRIAFAGQRNVGQPYDQTKNRIWIREPSAEIWELDSGQGRAPSWSPDGEWITFESNRGQEDGNYAIFVVPSDGGNAIQLTSGALNANHPSWSPDGRSIVFSAMFSDDLAERGIARISVPELRLE